MIIHAGVVLQGVVFASLMKPPDKGYIKVSSNGKTEAMTEQMHPECKEPGVLNFRRKISREFRERLPLSTFKDPRFPLFISVKGLTICGLVAMYKFSVARAIGIGIPKLPASTLVICNSVASTLFRTVGGAIANSRCVNRILMYALCTISGGAVVIASTVVSTQLVWHIFYQVLYGIASGEPQMFVSSEKKRNIVK